MTASLVTWSTLLRRFLDRLKPGDPAQSILPFIPRPLKWLFLIILLINSRGLPFAWHIRVFRPSVYPRIYHSIRNLLETPAQRVARLTRISPVGQDIFKAETVFKTRATPDACDLNFHLSNSSYAMTLDMARFKYVIEYFPLANRDGGWIGLGATHYVFTREIPMNSPYEIRLSLGAWDNKWMYTVARYVTYPSKTESTPNTINSPQSQLANGSSSSLTPPSMIDAVQSAKLSESRSSTPTLTSIGVPLPPGAVLHCTAISRVCVKTGRITIPPAIVIATAGFSMDSSRFTEILSWRLQDKGQRLKAFYAGGWRDVPEGERWWQDALGGEVEKKRVQGLKALAATVGIPVFPTGEVAVSNE